jgi:hypothetical protein
VDACLEGIRRPPEVYPFVHESYRRPLIRRFPYAVFYEPAVVKVTIYAALMPLATWTNGASAFTELGWAPNRIKQVACRIKLEQRDTRHRKPYAGQDTGRAPGA